MAYVIPRDQPKLPAWAFSAEVRIKARGFVRDRKVSRDRAPGTYWVQGSAREPYRVQTDADPEKKTASWISCSCKFGVERGAGTTSCSHAAAVLILVREGVEPPRLLRPPRAS